MKLSHHLFTTCFLFLFPVWFLCMFVHLLLPVCMPLKLAWLYSSAWWSGKGSNYLEVHLEPTLTLCQELVIKGECKKSLQVLNSLQGMERSKCLLSISQVSKVTNKIFISLKLLLWICLWTLSQKYPSSLPLKEK